MILATGTGRMAVLSDLHLGNPFAGARRPLFAFLEAAIEQGFDLCINGDGLDLAQPGFGHLARDVPDAVRVLQPAAARGVQICYVVGNHDIALESFLEDWGALRVAPFLTVAHRGLRIRIEHGHLYDPLYIRHPALYEWSTWLTGFAVGLLPGLYGAWQRLAAFAGRLRRGAGIPGEHRNFFEAARMLARRGFDAVVFGHTHCAGAADLGGGRRYLNPGSWMNGRRYVLIEDGEVSLETWEPGRTRVGRGG